MSPEPRWLFRLPWRTAKHIRDDFEEELSFHYDMRVAELVATGHSEAHARTVARGEFGDIEDARRYIRSVDGTVESTTQRRNFMRAFAHELGHAFRRLRRAPTATSTAVLSLALGIGACALVCNIVWNVLLRPLPFAKPDRIVMIWAYMPQIDLGFPEIPMHGRYFTLIRDEMRAFQSIAAFRAVALNLETTNAPERLDGVEATGEFFETIGVSPQLGRFFSRENEVAGSERVMVLSDASWRTRFAASRAVVGRVVNVNAVPYTIIGVAPAGFSFPRGAEMPGSYQLPASTAAWVPLIPPKRGPSDLAIVGRMRSDVSLLAARDDLDRIRAVREREFPAGKGSFGTQAVPLQTQLTGSSRPMLLGLLGAVALLVLLACVNTAQLQIAQLQSRRRELAIRAALGASSRRIVGALLIEALIVVGVAALIGTLFAWIGMTLVRARVAAKLPSLADASLDVRVVGIVIAATALAALIASLASSAGAARVPILETLRRGARGAGGSGTPARTRRILIAVELMLCVVLVSSAGLLVRSLSRQLTSATGFSAPNGLTFEVTLPPSSYPEQQFSTYMEHAAAEAFFTAALERIRALPGVDAAGIGKPLPLSGAQEATGFAVEGAPPPTASSATPIVEYTIASGDMLRALGTPMVAGRDFDAGDRVDSPPVVIVNKAMADKFWPSGSAVGKRLKLGGAASPAPWMTIVGVSTDIKRYSLKETPRPEMIVPYTQKPYPSFLSMQFVVRSSLPAAALVPELRRVVGETDHAVPISRVRSIPDLVGETTAQARFVSRFMSAFGAAALLLAMIGVYGVVAYNVSQRRQEFGVRRALGAERGDIIRLVAREGTVLLLVGVGCGLALSIASARLMRNLLYEVTAFDPATLAVTVLVLVGATTLACLSPAWRAARVEPRTALEEA